MQQVIQLLLSGLAQGAVYGLIALGFVLIYKATEVVSFAHGDIMMFGAFAGFILSSQFGISYWLAIVLSILFTALLSIIIEKGIISPILGQPTFSIVMLTFGLAYIMRGSVTAIPNIGTETHVFNVPYKDVVWNVSGLVINVEQLVVVIATSILCLALFLLFKYTRIGIAMQASSQNQLAAYYMGIPVKKLNTLIWGLSGCVAAIAGLLLAPITFVHANMGYVGLKAFPAAVVGGFGSLPGAIIGGLIIGVVESLSGFYLPPGFKDVSAYVLVLLMLMLRPNGIFGDKTRKKV